MPKKRDFLPLDQNSRLKTGLGRLIGLIALWIKVKGHVGQGQISVPKKGRWAHDNVKLLHLFLAMILMSIFMGNLVENIY